ncbi:DsbA family protein [Entomohabitans teleogrylli]|uniref:DsbA family protein n=1 Tax=Entomohabitans teleogrylli TaxID=1384589 RepID=UPI00073D8602|nr:DsbA family protein [Entomohabitans teleogrylli]
MNVKRSTVLGYTLFVALISALITVLFYHVFVFNTFSDSGEHVSLRELSAEQILSSPIAENNTIIEVMSYGCHYCASNEENLNAFKKTLPAGSAFKVIHITSDSSGLALYASLFATLEEMEIESKLRDSAYNAVITRNINLADDAALETWLVNNAIDVNEYRKVRQSAAVQERLKYMAAITQHYNISATPSYIINKRFVVTQDRNFPAFAEHMLELLAKGDGQ